MSDTSPQICPTLTAPAPVIAAAIAHFERKYGPLGDWLSVEGARRDADGWHVRAYINTWGTVYALVDDVAPADDYLEGEP